MKANYRVNKDLIIELEGSNQKELFEEMSSAAEIFGSNWEICGKCRHASFKPRPVVRVSGKRIKFFELHCSNPGCKARFVFGQSQDMKTLFPQRKFPEGHPRAEQYKPDGGWVVWRKEDDESSGTL